VKHSAHHKLKQPQQTCHPYLLPSIIYAAGTTPPHVGCTAQNMHWLSVTLHETWYD